MVRLALRSPVLVGVRMTVMLQLAAGITGDPAQVSGSLQSPGWAPPFEIALMWRAPVPTVVRLISWGAVLRVITWVSAMLAGLTWTTGTGASTSSAAFEEPQVQVGCARCSSRLLVEPGAIEPE